MMKPAALALLSLLATAGLAGPAAAQSRPTAITCDQYKKELSLAVTKTRRTDATIRAEREAILRQRAAQGLPPPVESGFGAEEDTIPDEPPARDYAGMERHRRAAEMACARRSYPEAINEFIQAFNLLGVPPPAHLPQPAP